MCVCAPACVSACVCARVRAHTHAHMHAHGAGGGPVSMGLRVCCLRVCPVTTSLSPSPVGSLGRCWSGAC